jgi:hypothetical protein
MADVPPTASPPEQQLTSPTSPPKSATSSPKTSSSPPPTDLNAPTTEITREIDVDDTFDDADSALGSASDLNSETTSVASSLLKGHIENGRKYATLRSDYWGPSDDRQFETMDAGHLLYLILESDKQNPLFRSPLTEPLNILDIGTGPGTWAIDTADNFPTATVHGVDMFPPPTVWVPPNCILEVEDVNQDWTWRKSFDLIHMRLMLGAFTSDEWERLYTQCYEHTRPGGWIEQLELDVRVMSDDASLDPSSLLASWGDNFLGCGSRAGRELNTQLTMRDRIEKAGYTNVHERLYKCPIGRWPRDRMLKEAGGINFEHWSGGLEGWAMFLLTKFGEPQPWTADEVLVYVAKVRQELLDQKLHIWHYTRRVWAQKPFEDSADSA